MKDKSTNEVTVDEVNDLMPGFKEALEAPEEKVIEKEEVKPEDSPKGGQPKVKAEPKINEVKEEVVIEKDSPKGGQPNPEVAAAISKANAKTQSELETIAKLIQGKPELLEKLKGENEKLFNKLQTRLPDVFKPVKEVKAEEKAEKLSKMFESLLKDQENKEMDAWRTANKITEADFNERQELFRENAITLVDEGIVTDWKKALDISGKISFPHLNGKTVDVGKLNKLEGENISVGRTVPEKREFSNEDFIVMKQNNLTEDEYVKLQGESLTPPGLNI